MGGPRHLFVEMVKGYGFDGADGGSFRLETVIFGGALVLLRDTTVCICS